MGYSRCGFLGLNWSHRRLSQTDRPHHRRHEISHLIARPRRLERHGDHLFALRALERRRRQSAVEEQVS